MAYNSSAFMAARSRDRAGGAITVMNPAISLLLTYIPLVIVLQVLGFGVSRLIDYVNPAWSLLVFLALFISAFGFAWPIAVRLTEPKPVKGAG
jgi:uncharacterized membrane protein YhaH (DUF805 family)